MRWSLLVAVASLGCASRLPAHNRFFVESNWARSTPENEYLGGHRDHRFQPVVADSLVIQGNAIDGIVAYDREGGKERWRFKVPGGIEGGATVSGDKVFFGASDGFLYALSLSTGSMIWSYPIRAEGLSAPSVEAGAVYYLSGNNILHAVDAESGKMLWLYSHKDSVQLSIRGGSQPTVAGGRIYVGLSDGFLVSLRTQDGGVIWEVSLNKNRRFRDIDSKVLIDGERIYATGFDSALYCIDARDGKILWTVDEGAYSGVALNQNTLFYSSSTGKVIAVEKASGKVLWSQVMPRGIATQPTIYKELLVVGEMNGALRFLSQRTGAEVGSFQTGWGVSARVTADDQNGRLYVMSKAANLYALTVGWRPEAQLWPWER